MVHLGQLIRPLSQPIGLHVHSEASNKIQKGNPIRHFTFFYSRRRPGGGEPPKKLASQKKKDIKGKNSLKAI